MRHKMITVSVNGRTLHATTRAELTESLSVINAQQEFELWIATVNGPAMCMLRSGDNAWLMYLREPGDSGLSSRGDEGLAGFAEYTLLNGQVDKYPLSWCVSLGDCMKALKDFWLNDGCKPEGIFWRDNERL